MPAGHAAARASPSRSTRASPRSPSLLTLCTGVALRPRARLARHAVPLSEALATGRSVGLAPRRRIRSALVVGEVRCRGGAAGRRRAADSHAGRPRRRGFRRRAHDVLTMIVGLPDSRYPDVGTGAAVLRRRRTRDRGASRRAIDVVRRQPAARRLGHRPGLRGHRRSAARSREPAVGALPDHRRALLRDARDSSCQGARVPPRPIPPPRHRSASSAKRSCGDTPAAAIRSQLRVQVDAMGPKGPTPSCGRSSAWPDRWRDAGRRRATRSRSTCRSRRTPGTGPRLVVQTAGAPALATAARSRRPSRASTRLRP